MGKRIFLKSARTKTINSHNFIDSIGSIDCIDSIESIQSIEPIESMVLVRADLKKMRLSIFGSVILMNVFCKFFMFLINESAGCILFS